MKNQKLKIISAILAVVLCFTSFNVLVFANSTDDFKIYYSGNYYDSIGGLQALLTTKESNDVLEELGDLIQSTDKKHPAYSGTSKNSLADVWQKSERAVNDTNKTGEFRLFFTNDYSNINKANSVWNREHLWPQSQSGGLYGTSGGGNDLHHLRPTYMKDNSKHSNKPFGNVNGGKEYHADNNSKNPVVFYVGNGCIEPLDQYKGDIARIYAYMITRYPTLLKLLSGVLVGGINTLVEWNEIDPVDSYEINRNQVAFEFQGNRNPYIDSPDLINVIWNNGIISGNNISDTDNISDLIDTSTDSQPTDTDKEIEVDTNTDSETTESITSLDNYLIVPTTLEDLKNGDKILLSNDKKGYFSTNYTPSKTNVLSCTKDLTLNEVWVYKEIDEKIYLETTDGSQLKAVSDKNTVLLEKPGTEIEFVSTPDGKIFVYSLTRVLRYNNSINGYRFYTSSDDTSTFSLFKLEKSAEDDTDSIIDSSTDALDDTDTSSDFVDCTDSDNELNTNVDTDTDNTTDTNLESDTDINTDTTTNSDTDSNVETTTDIDTNTDTNNDSEIIILGDINNDNVVTMADVIILQRHIAHILTLNSEQLIVSDINSDGNINMMDIVMMQKIIADLLDNSYLK